MEPRDLKALIDEYLQDGYATYDFKERKDA